jgi:hypothetical protein
LSVLYLGLKELKIAKKKTKKQKKQKNNVNPVPVLWTEDERGRPHIELHLVHLARRH